MTKRLPALLSLLLFLALCASLAYWLLQWLAPPPRPVAAPPVAERKPPPLAAAANLFGGNPQGSSLASVQLRGIIRSGRAGDSVAIIAAEGKPPRALRIDAEVLPGIQVKAINARTVVLSDKGAERELSLPEFVAQAGGMPETGGAAAPANAQANMPANAPAPGTAEGSAPAAQPASNPPANLPAAQATGSSGAGAAGTAAAGGEATAPAPRPEIRPRNAPRR